MAKGKYGVRDFSDIDTKSTPPQLNDRPYEGDPFCGNDNNRRSYEAQLQREREAAGIQEPAVAVLEPEAAGDPPVGDQTASDGPQEPAVPASAPSWTPRA